MPTRGERRNKKIDTPKAVARIRTQQEVWRLRIQEGHTIPEIAEKLHLSQRTVYQYIADQRKILEEANVYTTLGALSEFLARNEDVIKMAKERIAREERLEDEHKELVERVMDMAVSGGEGAKFTLPMPPRNAISALIAEVRRANEAFARVMGLEKNQTVNIALMGDFDLVQEAMKYGIDLEALGITPPTSTLQQVRLKRPVEGEVVSESTVILEGELSAPVPKEDTGV